jgi:hypothetical protein
MHACAQGACVLACARVCLLAWVLARLRAHEFTCSHGRACVHSLVRSCERVHVCACARAHSCVRAVLCKFLQIKDRQKLRVSDANEPNHKSPQLHAIEPDLSISIACRTQIFILSACQHVGERRSHVARKFSSCCMKIRYFRIPYSRSCNAMMTIGCFVSIGTTPMAERTLQRLHVLLRKIQETDAVTAHN